MSKPIIIATRGSALALAQSNMMKAACERAMPDCAFELKIIKTTGDKLQTASMTQPVTEGSTKGLFTKELEVALLAGEADLAVHSLKDLPTEQANGLTLAAVPPRGEMFDVLVLPEGRRPKTEGSDSESSQPSAIDRKSTRLNSSHVSESRMPSSA